MNEKEYLKMLESWCLDYLNGADDNVEPEQVLNSILNSIQKRLEPLRITELESQKSNYPSLTDDQLTLYVKIFSSVAKKLLGNIGDNEVKNFLEYTSNLQKVSLRNKDFMNMLYNWKQLIHIANRTSALMTAYMTGLCIGLFMTDPNLLPNVAIEDEDQNITDTQQIM